MNFSMSMCPTGCPVRDSIQFRLRAEHATSNSWRACQPFGIQSNVFTALFSWHNGRRYVRRNDTTSGVEFSIANGYPTTGVLTAGGTGSVTVASVCEPGSYKAADQIIRERTGVDSGTGIIYPFKDTSNNWGFFRDFTEKTYETAALNIGTFQNAIYQIVRFDASNDLFTIHYNGITGSATTSGATGNTGGIVAGQFGRNNLPIREIICYNRGLSAAERGYLHAYQKYDGGF